jgi:hypothetical protein
MKKYQLHKKVPRQNLPFLLLALIGSLLLGGIAFGLSQILYVVILFPLVMGLLGGLLNLFVIDRGKVRCLWAATVLGVLTGFTIYATFLYPGYLTYKSQFIGWENSTDDKEQAVNDQDFDQYLQEKTGSPGFVGYLHNRADEGFAVISQKHYAPDVTALNIQGSGVWLNWLLELGAICGITTTMARWRVMAPFSEVSNQWFNRATRLGTIAKTDLATAKTSLDAGKIVEFIDLVESQSPVVAGGWEVHFKRCGDNYNEVALTIGKAMIIRKKLKLCHQQAWLLNRQDLDLVATAMRAKHDQ